MKWVIKVFFFLTSNPNDSRSSCPGRFFPLLIVWHKFFIQFCSIHRYLLNLEFSPCKLSFFFFKTCRLRLVTPIYTLLKVIKSTSDSQIYSPNLKSWVFQRRKIKIKKKKCLPLPTREPWRNYQSEHRPSRRGRPKNWRILVPGNQYTGLW